MAKSEKNEPVEGEIVEEKTTKKAERNNLKLSDGRAFWGLLLILLGILFLLQNYFDIDAWAIFWPIILVFVGLFLILKSTKS